jgi:hypothetical protein
LAAGIYSFFCLRSEKIGAHKKLALRPDDDLQLGLIIKQAGLKQRLVIGSQYLQVEWYMNFTAAVKGLEKNMFAGVNYSLLLFGFGLAGMLIFYILPFLGLWIWNDWHFIVNVISIALMMSLYLIYSRKIFGESGYDVIVLPVLVLLFMYIFVRSCLLTLFRGGIYWRGTFYSLAELKMMKQGHE